MPAQEKKNCGIPHTKPRGKCQSITICQWYQPPRAPTEQPTIEILNPPEQYNPATGTTINISKTTITPLANAKIYNIDKKIQNLKISDPQDFVKILGIYFYFKKTLRTTGIYNWNLCLTQIEKQIQQLSRLSRRHLPYLK